MKGFIVFAGLLLPIPGVARVQDLARSGFQNMPLVDEIDPQVSAMTSHSVSPRWGRVWLQVTISHGLVDDVLMMKSELPAEAVEHILAKANSCKSSLGGRFECTGAGSHFSAMACGSGMIIWRNGGLMGKRSSEVCDLLRHEQRFMK